MAGGVEVRMGEAAARAEGREGVAHGFFFLSFFPFASTREGERKVRMVGGKRTGFVSFFLLLPSFLPSVAGRQVGRTSYRFLSLSRGFFSFPPVG